MRNPEKQSYTVVRLTLCAGSWKDIRDKQVTEAVEYMQKKVRIFVLKGRVLKKCVGPLKTEHSFYVPVEQVYVVPTVCSSELLGR